MTKLNGWLIIDKPVDITSAKVVSMVKKKLNVAKVGHGGTLDPFATGVLPLAIGQATKLMKFTLSSEKEYLFTIKFGSETDTGDRAGKIINTCNNLPIKEGIESIIPEFLGEIEQTPPAYSAIKINGERAYKLARSGIIPEMKSRIVHIKSLVLEEYNGSEAILRAICSKGTYIRSLGSDIAIKLGSLGHLSQLRRTRVGEFKEENSLKIDEVDNTNLLPPDFILKNIEMITIDAQQARDLKHGKSIDLAGNSLRGEVVAQFKPEDLLVIGEISNQKFNPKKVLC